MGTVLYLLLLLAVGYVVGAVGVKKGWPFWVTWLAALLVGVLAGALTLVVPGLRL